MKTFIFQRLLEMLLVLLVVICATFFLIRLAPGGPFDDEREMSEEVREKLEAQFGLDAPVPVQLGRYLGVWPNQEGKLAGLLQGKMQVSLTYSDWQVDEIIARKLPISLELGVYALSIALSVGIGLGLLAAWKPGSWQDIIAMSVAILGICLPTFVIGPLLLLVFSLKLDWFNASGWFLASDRVLPAITLGLFYAAYIARLTRSAMADVVVEPYMRTARAKGLGAARIYFVHGLRNGALPIVAFLAPLAAGLVTGSFVVEKIFAVPGLGRFFVESVFNRDHTLVLGCTIVYATLLVSLNFVADLILAFLNPKIRLSR